jgi:hypothetical protein
MSAIRGTYRNGRVELTDPPPADWEDGTEVQVSLTDVAALEAMEEAIQPSDPAAIEEWCASITSLRPFLTPEEEAQWLNDLEEHKRWEIEQAEASDQQAEEPSR